MWTSSYLLPDWANPYKLTEHDIYHEDSSSQQTDLPSYQRAIAQQLRIKERPPVDLVVNHVTHLCATQETKTSDNSDTSQDFKAYLRMDVMRRVYQYLQAS